MAVRKFPLPAREDFTPAYLDPAFWQSVVETLELTPQQAKVLCLILEGKQDKEITAEIGLSRNTIRDYLHRVFVRHGLEDRLQLVLRVLAMSARCREGQTA